MKKSLLFILACLTSCFAFAQDMATINNIKYLLFNGEATVMVQDKESLSDDIVIPEIVSYNGADYKVTAVSNSAFAETGIISISLPNSITSMGSSCFKDCSRLTSIRLSNSITFLDEYCFYGCYSLKSITLPDGLTSLGDWCFYNCSGLTSITLPNSITSLGDCCFHYCSSLSSVTLPNSITSLGSSCFRNCRRLTSVTLPNSITSLGSRCFNGCSSLTSVTLPNSITSLSYGCFNGCSSLTSVTLPNSITSLGSSCFEDCSSLTSITLPNSITSLGRSCFNGCSSLTSIILPNSITSLGEGCFRNCSSLTSITLPNSITSLGSSCFYNCSSLTSITLPNSITSLGSSCFNGCSSLTSIILPNSITSLGSSCFARCGSLTSITLPNSITSLGSSCFLGCSSLFSVTCEWENLDDIYAGTDIFSNIFSEARLYVPKGTTDIYRAKEPWSGFKYINEVDGGTSSEPEKCATPIISYEEKRIVFTSDTEGAEYHYTITAPDAKTDAYSENGTVDIAAAYEISVYASADGYTNSDEATATLYFINAGLETGIDAVAAAERGVLVSQDGQSVTVSGLDDGETVALYTASGMMLSAARAVAAGTVTLETKNERGVIILKVGNESLKISL